jgi:hypothetical protein
MSAALRRATGLAFLAAILSASLALMLSTPLTFAKSTARIYKPVDNRGGLALLPLNRLSSVHTEVIEGETVEPSAFPASYFASMADIPGVPRCTATLVGPKALLTAAHCVGEGQAVSIDLGATTYGGPCHHHPGRLKGVASADLALCALTEAPNAGLPEAISLSPSNVKKGQKVLLAGYGCTNKNGQDGSGVFRIGRTKVQNAQGYDKSNPFYFETISSPKDAPAIICPGDSGGAVYCLTNIADPKGKRVVCGVNSAVECLDWVSTLCVSIGKTSYLASVASAATWFKSRPDQPAIRDLKICGVDSEISHLCRTP